MAIFKFRNLKSGQATPISPGTSTIGRAEDATVQVDDSSVSRHHARLINEEEGYFLEDLGSANGVAVQGTYVTGRVPVKLGDLVHIGKVPFRLDPEVPGELTDSAPLRRVDRAFMRRETEKIPASTEEPSTTSGSPVPQEPPTPAAISYLPSMAEPTPEREASKSGALIRKSVPLPALVKLIAPPSETPEPAATPDQSSAGSGAGFHAEPVMVETEPMPWWWWLIVFLAGLGSGLLLGLYFAKVFLELGGRPGSLP